MADSRSIHLCNEELFHRGLDATRKSQLVDLPDLSGQINHAGRVTVFPQDELAPGLYVNNFWVPDDTKPDRITYTPRDLLAMGKGDSQHEVMFGDLQLSWFNNGASDSQRVAIKSSNSKYGENTGRLMHEIGMQQHMENIGIPTFRVIGALVVPLTVERQRIFSVSEFDPDVTTLDNLDWRHMDEEKRWDSLDFAIDTLVLLHKNLIFHGDPEFKNIAIRQTENDLVVVDVETAESCSDLVGTGLERDEDRIKQCMSADFSSISKSIDEYIIKYMPEETKPRGVDRFELLLERLYLPYIERLTKNQAPDIAVLLRQFDKVIAQRALEATGNF